MQTRSPLRNAQKCWLWLDSGEVERGEGGGREKDFSAFGVAQKGELD